MAVKLIDGLKAVGALKAKKFDSQCKQANSIIYIIYYSVELTIY